MAFSQSSQKQCWTFTEEELATLRKGGFEASEASRLAAGGKPQTAAEIDDFVQEAGSSNSNSLSGQLSGTKRSWATALAEHESSTNAGEESAAGSKRAGGSGAEGGPLSFSEQQLLLAFFELDIARTCEECGFDVGIAATAVTYFKRFYLHNAVTEHFPGMIAPAAVFLAIKVEACPYTEVQDFCSRLARISA